MYRLMIVAPSGASSHRDIDKGAVVVGRAEECDLVIDDPFLSRRQARFFIDEGGLFAEDLGSGNGTLINGSLIERKTLLNVGDEVRLSDTTITVQLTPENDLDADVAAPAALTALRPLSELLPQEPEVAAAAEETEESLRRYAARLKLLNDVHRALGESLSLDELLELVLDGAFEHLGPEEAAVWLKDEDGELQRAASRSSTGSGDERPVSQTLIQVVVEEGQAALALDVTTDQRFKEAQSILASGQRSLLAAPLLDRSGNMGMIVLSSSMHNKLFTEEDMELLASLASVAVLRIRNIALAEHEAARQRLERELSLARQVQEAVLPDSLPTIEGYELEAWNDPSRGVSGDIYQAIERQDPDGGGDCVLMIADVCGKGMAASLLSLSLEATFSALVAAGVREPENLFAEVNRHLYRKTSPAKFATGVLAILDPTTGAVRYVNAGHNPPLLVRSSRQLDELEATGFPLAMTPDSEYTAGELTLETGDLLVLFTDGIVEAQNPEGEEFQLDRLVELLIEEFDSDVHAIRSAIERRLDEFALGVPFGDDRTMILIRRQ